MPRFDPRRLADLVDEESRLRNSLNELSLSLNEQHAADKNWDEVRLNRYSADQARHAQLSRQLEMAHNERKGYELSEPEAAKRASATPFARWLRSGESGLEADERNLHLGEMSDGALPGGGGPTFIIRAATASDAASGEEAVQERVLPRVIDTLAYYGGVSQMAQQFFTDTGGDFRIPQMDADDVEGEILAAQNTAVANKNLENIGIQTFGADTGSSKSIIVTREMIQDAVFDIQSYVERQAIRRLGKAWNNRFTSDSTIGVATTAKDGITAAAVDKVTWVELTNLIYAINRAYRTGMEGGEGGFSAEGGGMIGYMISDDAEKAVRVLLDSDGRPLWVPSTREGAPSMLNGFPYRVNNHLDGVATGKTQFCSGTSPTTAFAPCGPSRYSASGIPARPRRTRLSSWPSAAGTPDRWEPTPRRTAAKPTPS